MNRSLQQYYRIYKYYLEDYWNSKGSQIKLFNYQIVDFNKNEVVHDASIQTHWLYQFIDKRKLLKNTKANLSIFGINGDPLAINIDNSEYKIFYTIENVHNINSPWVQYKDLLLENSHIDLSLGFDYLSHPDYIRFPYWIMAKFRPDETHKSIKLKCDEINDRNIDINGRNKFCSFFSRHDYFGERKYFAEQVSQINDIMFPGKFMHNDDDCMEVFKQNKHQYLKQFKFNLCPENTNHKGYVTEKIFDAMWSGCIPIYWGSDNCPEPDLINQDSFLKLSLHGDNTKCLDDIRAINTSKTTYEDFLAQKVLLDDAADHIYGYFNRLEIKINEIIKA